MSTSYEEQKMQWVSQVGQAIDKRDIERLFQLASIIFTFDEEWGTSVRDMARKFEREDWQHDETKGN